MELRDPNPFGDDTSKSRGLAMLAWLGSPTGRRVWSATLLVFLLLGLVGVLTSTEELPPA